MAAAEAGVLQQSTPGVLASAGRVGVAGLSTRSPAAAPLVLRVPPAKGEGLRSSTCAWGSRTGAWRRPCSSEAKGKATSTERLVRESTRPVQPHPACS
eukprot:5948106-Pleurochrysis_carterae.AAC.1